MADESSSSRVFSYLGTEKRRINPGLSSLMIHARSEPPSTKNSVLTVHYTPISSGWGAMKARLTMAAPAAAWPCHAMHFMHMREASLHAGLMVNFKIEIFGRWLASDEPQEVPMYEITDHAASQRYGAGLRSPRYVVSYSYI